MEQTSPIKGWWGVVFGVLTGLLSAGLLLLVSRNPTGKPIQLVPPPTPLPYKVYIAGAVQLPGVYALSPDARIEDALRAAGGAAEDADMSLINLAAPIEDGQRIWIPTISPSGPAGSIPESGVENTPIEGSRQRININTATQAQLETLPHIGPELAKEIIRYRQEHGSFKNITAIQEVPGIGPSIFDKIKDLITVGDQPMD